MKKTVQIITIPLNQRTNFGLFQDAEDNEIIFSDTSIKDNPYFSPLQLLVLSDDVQDGDVSYHSGSTTHTYDRYSCAKDCKKVIGSYPNIPNTLPLSKETIQQWIDNGTPEEGSVEFKKTIEKSIVNEWNEINTLYTDSQGNLILEFPISTYDGIDFETIKKEIYQIVSDEHSYNAATELILNVIKYYSFKSTKPSIPTDEKIEEKAAWWIGNQGIKKETLDEENEIIYAYTCGYQEALKDLGYEK